MALVQFLGYIGGALLIGGASMASFGPGFGDIITRNLNNLFQGRYPSIADLLRSLHKKEITKEQFIDWMKWNGYPETFSEILLQSYPDQLNPGEILQLWYRYRENPGNEYDINEAWLETRMKQAGLDPRYQKEWLEANRPVPPLDDVTRFAVRDVFEEDQAKLAGLYENLPETYLIEARKRGLSDQDAKYYWAAHWALPGLHTVYEMFHRLHPGARQPVTFTEKDMDLFFQLADIAPGFRAGLKAISYPPIGRVDIRRFWRVGLYNTEPDPRAALILDYRQLGYSPQNAARMADFTIQYEGQGRRKLTMAQVLRFYREGVFKEAPREEAKKLLLELKFSESNIDFLLDYEDLKKIEYEEQQEIDRIQAQYNLGLIRSDSDLYSELSSVPLEHSAINKTIERFKRELEKQRSRLKRSEVDALYQAGVISKTEFREYLRILGYAEIDIERIIVLYGKGRAPLTALPSKEDILSWFAEEIIGSIRFVGYLRTLGYSDQLIVYYAASSGRELDDQVLKELEYDNDESIDEIQA